jgi:hypothetical protein
VDAGNSVLYAVGRIEFFLKFYGMQKRWNTHAQMKSQLPAVQLAPTMSGFGSKRKKWSGGNTPEYIFEGP